MNSVIPFAPLLSAAGREVRARVANHARTGLSGIYDHSTYDEEAEAAWRAWGNHLSMLSAKILFRLSTALNEQGPQID